MKPSEKPLAIKLSELQNLKPEERARILSNLFRHIPSQRRRIK